MPDPSPEKQSTEDAERAALAALTRGIKLDQVQDAPGAVRAYLQAVESGRLSQTGPGREAGAQAAFNLGPALGEAEDTAGAFQAYRASVEMGRLSERTVGREAGAAAAFNLGLILEEGHDTAGALHAYRDSVELGRLSETGAGREAGAKAAFALALMLGEAEDLEGALQAYRDSVELGRLSDHRHQGGDLSDSVRDEIRKDSSRGVRSGGLCVVCRSLVVHRPGGVVGRSCQDLVISGARIERVHARAARRRHSNLLYARRQGAAVRLQGHFDR